MSSARVIPLPSTANCNKCVHVAFLGGGLGCWLLHEEIDDPSVAITCGEYVGDK